MGTHNPHHHPVLLLTPKGMWGGRGQVKGRGRKQRVREKAGKQGMRSERKEAINEVLRKEGRKRK